MDHCLGQEIIKDFLALLVRPFSVYLYISTI